MNQPVAPPADTVLPMARALRPLGGLVGRGGELGRMLGHLDARRSIRVQAPRGMGSTALLRALCAEPPRPGTPDGTVALPAGLPVADMSAAAAGLLEVPVSSVVERELLVLLDDPTLDEADLERLRGLVPRSLIVVTGAPDSDVDGLTPVVVGGLSQHHAVGLVEAAMGRSLSIEEGRAAREVATATAGMPAALVQAAALVRHGGLSFGDVLVLLDDPVRPAALTIALQHALPDDLHVTLSHLRGLGEAPITTTVAAAACALPRDEAQRRLRQLAVLGLVFTDGRDGWTTAGGLPPVAEPVKAGAAERLATWLADADETLDVFDVASVLSTLADRVSADDRVTSAALAQAALDTLRLSDLDATTDLVTEALAWAIPVPTSGEDALGAERIVADDDVVDGQTDTSPAPDSPTEAGLDVEPWTPTAPATAVGLAGSTAEPGALEDAEPATTSALAATAAEDPTDGPSGLLASLTGDRRRLALVAVAAAAVVAAVLLVVPSLRSEPTVEVVSGDVDLGVTAVDTPTSGTVALDLTGTDASTPLDLVLGGPDAEDFVVEPPRCDSLDCRASLTFTPNRAGPHVATVTALDATGAQYAVVGLTGSGTGDPPESPASTNLAVTLFPTDPSPIPDGGSAVLPVGVRNNGPDDSTGARLLVSVPDQVSATASGCSFEAPQLTCPLATIPNGSQERVEIRLSIPEQTAEVRITAEVVPVTDVDGAEGDNSAGFTYPVEQPPPAEEEQNTTSGAGTADDPGVA